jgi:hypothetical protein
MKNFIDYFSHIFLGFKDYFTTVKYFNKPEFKTKGYNLHFYYSLVIGLVVMFGMFWFTPIEDISLASQIVIGGFIGWGMNFFKEWLWVVRYGVQPDFKDIYFGSYGVIVSTLLIALLWFILY